MKTKLLLAAAALAAALALPARAADPHAHHRAPAQAGDAGPSAARVRYDDAVLIDQDGRPVKLKSEVIGDRLIVLDFIYTSCTTACPVLSAQMAQVQAALGPQAMGEVRLVSISLDPARDTPARMKEYGQKFGAQPGWVWLTGPTGRVNEVLRGFGAYVPNFEDHPPQTLVGDARTGEWTRFYGFTDPKLLVARVNELRAARAAHGAHAGHGAGAHRH